MYCVPGRKYVLERAETRRKSFRTLDIRCGTSAKVTTRVYRRVLEMGIVDAWRMRSGMGRGGVVTMMEGIPRRRVAAFSTRMAVEEKGDAEESWKKSRINGMKGR
jgi:hypothetical protein